MTRENAESVLSPQIIQSLPSVFFSFHVHSMPSHKHRKVKTAKPDMVGERIQRKEANSQNRKSAIVTRRIQVWWWSGRIRLYCNTKKPKYSQILKTEKERAGKLLQRKLQGSWNVHILFLTLLHLPRPAKVKTSGSAKSQVIIKGNGSHEIDKHTHTEKIPLCNLLEQSR